MASCQDHHFVPIEKADKIKFPAPGQSAPHAGFAEGPQAQKQVMAEATKQQYAPPPPPAPGQLIAQGSIELGAEQKKRDFSGWTVYIIIRNENMQGPPIAAVRYDAAKFPMAFRADTNDLMMGTPPAAGTKIRVEARLDKDGDPMSKTPGDVWGITVDAVAVGSKTAKIVLNQDRK
ncbi:MAG: hypothetical protein HZA04_01180 [Nitrospinae bacterium]|nr:hypothetical protein [Nitrospinota bacterium]